VIPLKDDNPVDRAPIITVLLIAANVLAFLWQLGVFEWSQVQATGGDVVDFATRHLRASIEAGGVVPYEIVKLEDIGFRDLVPPPFTIFTSMFLHGDAIHLASNMLFLWVFGNNIEDSVGRIVFIPFYLLSGIVAVYAQSFLDTSATVPTIGASGAVSGVLGAYALLHPHARVLTLVFIIFFVTLVEIPAMVMLGLWFVLQFLPAVGQLATPDVAGQTGGVAYFAHIGGFIVGLALIKLLARRHEGPTGPGPPYPVY
jgi:membrane associated rhomboid family serine protease